MKLEAGRFYRQRNGGNAYVAAVDETKREGSAAIGWNSERLSAHWYIGGNFLAYAQSNRDLIAEWVDEPPTPKAKRKVEKWTRVYDSEQEALKDICPEIVPITVEVDDDV